MNIYVISSGRPGNVPLMAPFLKGLRAIWVVRRPDAPSYGRQRAQVHAVDGDLADQRNHALDDAFEQLQPCIQIDDDLRKLIHYDLLTGLKTPILVMDAVALIRDAMGETGARYGGTAPTENPYFCRTDIATHVFVPSHLTVTLPTDLRYDPGLALKEDWDFTCQHLTRYGTIARRNDVLATFQARTNPGGVQRYRTPQLEKHTTDLLLNRWPDLLRPHGRREHQLAIRRGRR